MSWYSEWREFKAREIPEKTCGCGKKHYVIPENSIYHEDWGTFFNCECKSTLLIPNKKLLSELKKAG